MIIDIVGEDQVTQAIIERLISDYRSDMTIGNRLPVRGSQIKNLAPNLNRLGSPVFILTDLDTYVCPPSLIQDWFNGDSITQNVLFRIAQEEAETWLMADREGFSKWMGTDKDLIPSPQVINRQSGALEIILPLKPSLYMMLNIASQSRNEELKQSLTPVTGAKKGPGYNSAILPFIKNKWNVENAIKNSYSLSKAVFRLQNFGV